MSLSRQENYRYRNEEQDRSDLVSVTQIMVQRLYVSTGDSYRRSLFELARFQKIAGELGVPLPKCNSVLSVSTLWRRSSGSSPLLQ